MVDIIRIQEPGELIALVPRILGFAPRESVVVLGVDRRGRICMTARLDRADCRVDDMAVALADATASEAVRTGSVGVVVLEYADAPVPWGTEASETLVREWDGIVEVRDIWIVQGDRYWSPGCDDASCCPPGGRTVPEPGAVGGAARPRPRARAAATTLSTASGEERRRARRARARFVARRTRDESAWRQEAWTEWRLAIAQPSVGVPCLGRLGASIAVPEVRDAVILEVFGGGEQEVLTVLHGGSSTSGGCLDEVMSGRRAPDSARVDPVTDLLLRVAAVSRAPERAHALGVVALLRWWQGEPSASTLAADAALRSDGSHRLAALVKETAARGILPGWLRIS